MRVDARGEGPHHVVHRVDVHVGVHCNGEPHTLIARKNSSQEIALPAFLDLVAFFHLDDASAPIGHAVRNVDVLDDTGLQALT